MKPLFSFIYTLQKLQQMSEKTIKCCGINLHLKLNLDLHETDWYEELNRL